MGFRQMVCRLHEGEEEEEEEEEEEDEGDEEEADPFQIGRGTLDMVWMQHDLQRTLPFVDPDTSAADVIYDYEVKGDINSALDWEERNGIYMQVRKRPLLSTFLKYIYDHFTKTGSGRTYEKLKKCRFLAGNANGH